MGNKILIFDFDGTVADVTDSAIRVYNRIAEEGGYKTVTRDNLALVRNMSAIDAIRYAGIPMLKLPFIANRVRAGLTAEVPNFKVIPGIKEPLQALKAKGHQMHIVSSNSKENITRFLKLNGMGEFDGVHSVSSLFGKHSKIKSLIRASGWDKADVMYIGDEVRDVDAATKAGVTPVSVTWGHNTEEALAKANPGILLKNPSELTSI